MLLVGVCLELRLRVIRLGGGVLMGSVLVRKVGLCRDSVVEAGMEGAVWRPQEMAELWAFGLRWAHE